MGYTITTFPMSECADTNAKSRSELVLTHAHFHSDILYIDR